MGNKIREVLLMIVTVCKGGDASKRQPVGYGLKVKVAGRGKYFHNQRQTVFVDFEGVI